MPSIDLRCPVGPRKLLARLVATGERPVVVPGNLMELHCRDCSRDERIDDPDILRVLHRYDFAAILGATEPSSTPSPSESVYVWRDGRVEVYAEVL